MKQYKGLSIFPTAAALTEAAAAFIVAAACKAIEARGKFVISLSGGHTPEQLFTLLSQPPYQEQVPWDKTFVFWGDERCVALDDKDNNAQMARTKLLDHIDIPQANIFPIPVNLPPAEAAKDYEGLINKFFNGEKPCFDLILLGLGENGHTASLFPGTEVLNEHTRLVKEVYVAELQMSRITMTAKLIDQARNIIFLVAGTGKAEILNTILNSPYQPDKYPAQLIRPVQGNLYWYADDEAAKALVE